MDFIISSAKINQENMQEATNLIKKDNYPNDLVHGLLTMHSYQMFYFNEVTATGQNPRQVQLSYSICYLGMNSTSKNTVSFIESEMSKWYLINVIPMLENTTFHSYGMVYANEEKKQIVIVYQAICFEKTLAESIKKKFKRFFGGCLA